VPTKIGGNPPYANVFVLPTNPRNRFVSSYAVRLADRRPHEREVRDTAQLFRPLQPFKAELGKPSSSASPGRLCDDGRAAVICSDLFLGIRQWSKSPCASGRTLQYCQDAAARAR
jgi:hypothetical protein